MQPRKVEILPSFEAAYDALPQDVQERTQDALVHFSERTADNSLRPELKNGFDNVWSIRITKGYRAFYKKLRDSEGAIFCMFHVGHHDDYRALKKLSARISVTAHGHTAEVTAGAGNLRVVLQARGAGQKTPKR